MYFTKFPFTEYKGQQIRNITLRCTLTEEVKQNASQLLPYELQFQERPENLAYDYYGSVDYYWLVFYANDVYNPYRDWYQDDYTFNLEMTKKYGSVEDTMQEIIHYNIDSDPAYDDIIVSKDTVELQNLLAEGIVNPQPVTRYDIEYKRNEALRTVKLVERDLAPNTSSTLQRLLNDRG